MSSNYRKGAKLGEGQWGHVYEAFCADKTTGRQTKVAIKRIKPIPTDSHLPPGINFTAIREIKYMRQLQGSPFILSLVDVFISEEQQSDRVLHLVIEFCSYDLEKVIRDKSILLQAQHTKKYMEMLLNGIEWCHSHFILHRDLKPANLLIGGDGRLKLADFGLARSFSSPERLTHEVVTMWYRSPELLFGATAYAEAIDMWAVGVIFAELILRVPLFPGESDLDQLGKVFNVLGTPITCVTSDVKPSDSGRVWENADLLPSYVEFEACDPLDLTQLFGGTSGSLTLNLLQSLLVFNPNKRATAVQCLKHAYFTTAPLPSTLDQLPRPALAPHIHSTTSSGSPQGKRLKVGE